MAYDLSVLDQGCQEMGIVLDVNTYCDRSFRISCAMNT